MDGGDADRVDVHELRALHPLLVFVEGGRGRVGVEVGDARQGAPLRVEGLEVVEHAAEASQVEEHLLAAAAGDRVLAELERFERAEPRPLEPEVRPPRSVAGVVGAERVVALGEPGDQRVDARGAGPEGRGAPHVA